MIRDITVVGVTFLPSRAILTALLSWLARIGLWLATPTGIEGVEGTHAEHFLVSPDWDSMTANIVSLLENRELAIGIARNARRMATDRYSEESLSRTARPLLEDFADVARAANA